MASRWLTIVVLLGAGCHGPRATPPHPPTPPADAPAFAVLVRGDLAEVQQADRLYERADSPHFFVRLRIHNLRPTSIAIDLRDDDLVLYPNQWGGLPAPQRTTIDESREVPVDLDEARRAALRAAFAATPSPLVHVPAGGDVDLYREFNASGRAEIDAVTEPWLYVSMAGQLLITDGTQAENLGLDPPATGAPGDAGMFTTPVRWGQVPPGARVLRR